MGVLQRASLQVTGRPGASFSPLDLAEQQVQNRQTETSEQAQITGELQSAAQLVDVDWARTMAGSPPMVSRPIRRRRCDA